MRTKRDEVLKILLDGLPPGQDLSLINSLVDNIVLTVCPKVPKVPQVPEVAEVHEETSEYHSSGCNED